ncbi:MAG: Phosphopantetheine adenylyltransferase [Myxococcota bacterium]|nr:Phosphopantetheine adenylyltransferase [Myxococcota bacterium]
MPQKSPLIAIYPGSFDPLTLGHLNIIQRSLKLFDSLVVAIVVNPNKQSLFSLEERRAMIEEALGKDRKRVRVDSFSGLLVDYVRAQNARAIIRGLRAVSDFEYEFQMAHMNRSLYPDVETIFMMAGEDHFYVSSRLVREVASLGGDVSPMTPPNVHRALLARFPRKEKP